MKAKQRSIRKLGYALAVAMVVTPVGAGQAQQSVKTMAPVSSGEMLRIARLFGSAAISRQKNGDPLIAGAINHIPYALRFLNCANRDACEDINFRVGFQVKPSIDVINAWNASKRFSRAYLDGEGDAILEMDVVINGGVSTEMLNSSFEYWRLSLNQFVKHIGFQ